MRKNDQILMWEAYIGESSEAVSMGGPLKVGGNKASKKSSSEDAEDEDMEDENGDPYEDEEDELHGVLKKCHSGDITPQEAHKHITKMMKGNNEEDAENIKRERPVRDIRKETGVRGPGSSPLNRDRRPERIKQSKKDTAKFRKESGLSGKFPTTTPREV